MELEELKKQRNVIKAPTDQKGNGMKNTSLAIDSLIEMLRTEDAKQATLLKRARPFWWIAAGLMTFSAIILSITNLKSSAVIDPALPLRGLLAIVFIGIAVVFYVQVKRLRSVDYTEPVLLFLRKAAARYQFMTVPYFVLSILVTAILALATSVYIDSVFERYFDIHDSWAGLLSSFAFVAAVYLFGFFVSKKDWNRSKKPVLDRIEEIQAQLRSENGSES